MPEPGSFREPITMHKVNQQVSTPRARPCFHLAPSTLELLLLLVVLLMPLSSSFSTEGGLEKHDRGLQHPLYAQTPSFQW